MIKRFSINLLIIIFSIFLAFVVLEIFLRIYNSYFNVVENVKDKKTFQNFAFNNDGSNLHVFDEVKGWSLSANYNKNDIIINKNGYRTTLSDNSILSEKAKILILGDSMVFGSGVNQKEIFSEKLNETNKDLIFINSGVIGYSTLQEYLVLRENITIPNLKFIILFHTLANDMWMNIKNENFNPAANLKNGKLILLKPKKIYYEKFYKKTFIYKFLDKSLLKGRDLEYLFHRIDFAIRGDKSHVWKVQEKIIREIIKLTNNSSIPIIIVDIPTRNQLNNFSISQVRQELMKKICEETNTKYYSLFDFYPKNWIDLFIDKDTHWNNTGHTFIAKFIQNTVLKDIN